MAWRMKVTGPYAWMFWTMAACCFFIPLPLLAFRRTRTIPGIFAASFLICVGMWLERYLIVVPSLHVPMVPGQPPGEYTPSWVEISVAAGEFAGMTLLFAIFSKVFPLVSIWEVEGKYRSPEPAAAVRT